MAECLFRRTPTKKTALCCTFLFCFFSNSIQHRAWRKSLRFHVHLGRASTRDDRRPQVDNDDDLIRSLSLVWSRPKLLHPADGINLATVKKSRAILYSLPPPPHNFSFLSCKYHLQSETENILPFWHHTARRLWASVTQACIPSHTCAHTHSQPNQAQSSTCVALTWFWNINTMHI